MNKNHLDATGSTLEEPVQYWTSKDRDSTDRYRMLRIK